MKATSIHDNGETIRVYMMLGPVTEGYIDIRKSDGSAPDASVKADSMLWGKMYRTAAAAIKKQYPGQYPEIM